VVFSTILEEERKGVSARGENTTPALKLKNVPGKKEAVPEKGTKERGGLVSRWGRHNFSRQTEWGEEKGMKNSREI